MKKRSPIKGSGSKKIKRLLIANRGEIACRIARTCRARGIETVAIHSPIDRYALHLRLADEARLLKGNSLQETYLNIKAIVELAKGCDAIHPGYGFLSENPLFAKAVEDAGVIFVGPPSEVIKRAGNKLLAKECAVTEKVPVLEIFHITPGEKNSAALENFIKSNQFPLMVKAASGGGGRGMRLVLERATLDEAIVKSSNEALNYFGDATVFLEPALLNVRHIEVQLLGDQSGEIVALGDRDCSLQRRHQKIIEEAPAPGLSSKVRRAMHAAAIRLGGALGYIGAGTVEFLVAGDKFYFLEINSRLQVEHPVTEAIYGLDLVALQLQIAEGKRLSKILPASKRRARGNAIEVRLCAENPAFHFAPSSGIIEELRIGTQQKPSFRFDSGFAVGDLVPPNYDSLIGKVIVYSSSRERARAEILSLLSTSMVAGIYCNISLLTSLLSSKPFKLGKHSTATAQEVLDRPQLRLPGDLVHELTQVVATSSTTVAHEPWAQNIGWRLWGAHKISEKISINNRVVTVRTTDYQYRLEDFNLVQGVATFLLDGEPQRIELFRGTNGYWINHDGEISFSPNPEQTETLTKQFSDLSEGGEIRAPLPGKVLSLAVKQGERIKSGTVVVTLESMKMEHPVRALVSGAVTKIAVTEGDNVSAGMLLLNITP